MSPQSIAKALFKDLIRINGGNMAHISSDHIERVTEQWVETTLLAEAKKWRDKAITRNYERWDMIP